MYVAKINCMYLLVSENIYSQISYPCNNQKSLTIIIPMVERKELQFLMIGALMLFIHLLGLKKINGLIGITLKKN